MSVVNGENQRNSIPKVELNVNKKIDRQTKDTGRSSGWNFQQMFMISCRRGGQF
jgi:hypothetical protein